MNQLLSDIQKFQQLDFTHPVSPITDPAMAEIGDALETLRVTLGQHLSRVNEQPAETTKKELANLIAHELRNPLNSIIGFASLMMEENDTTEEERKKYLSIIKQNGHSMNEMITRFLAAQHFDSPQDDSLQ